MPLGEAHDKSAVFSAAASAFRRVLVTTHCHVLGPGALGGLFAFRLQALGFQVSLVARNPVSHQQELTLLTSDSEETIRFSIQGPDAQESISLLWVTTKSYATLEAVTRLRHRFTAETLIVTLGNGMGYHSALSARFPGKTHCRVNDCRVQFPQR